MLKLFRTAAAAAALLLATGLAAAEDKKKKAPTAAGKVKAVDATASKITLEGKKGKDGTPGPEIAVDVAKDAKVTIKGEARTLADIKVGDPVTLTLSDDKKTATAVAIVEKKPAVPTAAGKVKAIDAAALKVTLEGKKGKDGTPGPDVAVDIAKDAKVTINGEAKTLADVKVGDPATLTLSADKKTATAVTVGKKAK